jgi:4'-phosphopantetheinyl transferase EntD
MMHFSHSCLVLAKETHQKVPINSHFSVLNPATLSTGFASLFPTGVVAAELRAPGAASNLLPEEAESIANAVPKRIQEFAAGRLCARRALEEFGVTHFPVRVAQDRQPVWPESLIGSITHTVGLCAAVVAERSRFMALGVDSEIVGAVKVNLRRRICVEAEMAWIEELEPAGRAAAATLIFSAKEAFFKCQYPLVGERLNFHDLRVTALEWGAPVGVFTVAPTRPLAVFNRTCTPMTEPVLGSYRFHEEFVSAGVNLAAI